MGEDKVPVTNPPKVVLFIDDEIEILNSLRRQFADIKLYQTIFESNPSEVTNILNSQEVDIIVADIVMPEIDGITLLSKIKETHPSIIRILLTAHGDMTTTVRALNEAEVFGFITKPWEKSYLLGHLAMASKVHDEHRNPKILIQIPAIISANWSDNDGVSLTSRVNERSEELIRVLINKGFMSAAALYGLDNRFNNTKFTLPIDDMNSQIRCYLTTSDDVDKASGMFVITNILDAELEQKVDQIISNIKSIDPEGFTSAELDLLKMLK